MTKETEAAKKYNNSRFKRTIDILAGVIGLPPALIAVALVGLVTKIEDGGDVFFKQPRIGRGGKTFEMYKLRTFNTKGEKTKVGKAIRPFAIDEFPQFFNILRGDMSLFGIRAISQENFEQLIQLYKDDPNFDEEFLQTWIDAYCSARPGGFALAVARARSVFYRGYEDSAGVRRKMEHDIEQVRTASFTSEMRILLTIIAKALRIHRERVEYTFRDKDIKVL